MGAPSSVLDGIRAKYRRVPPGTGGLHVASIVQETSGSRVATVRRSFYERGWVVRDVSVPFADGGEVFFHLLVREHSELVFGLGDDRDFDLVCFEILGEHGLDCGDGHPHAFVVGVLRVVFDLLFQEVGGFLFLGTGACCLVSYVEPCWIHLVQLGSQRLVHADQHGGDGEGTHAGLLGGHLRLICHELGQVIHGDLAPVPALVIRRLFPRVLHHGLGVWGLSDRHHAHARGEWKEVRHTGRIQELVRYFLLGHHTNAVYAAHAHCRVSGRLHRLERVFHLVQPPFG
eukprot:scaffold2858_cov659-Pavlova_lutheri.AAC.8